MLGHLDHELSFQLSVWDVQDTPNRFEHGIGGAMTTDLWKKRLIYSKRKNIRTRSANLWLNPLFSLVLPFVQKNSEGSMSKHTPIHNSCRSFSALNKRNFYWTLQAALEPKIRFIAILEKKTQPPEVAI